MACIRKRRGKWVIDYRDQFGKRHWETCSSKKEAEERLAEVLLEIRAGTFSPARGTMLFKDLASLWFENHAKLNVRPNTCYTYQGHLNKHLIPFFGNMKVSSITPAVVDRFKAEKLKQGLHRETINKSLTILGSIFRYAVKNRFLRYNIMQDVDKLRTTLEEKREDREREINILSPQEVLLLIKHTVPKYRPLILTAVLTGMRQSELLALQWDDIDWNAGQVYVRRMVYRGRFFEPKSRKSKRKVDMTPVLISVLKRWRLACPPSKYNLVFPTQEGNPMNPANLRRRIFEPALRRAGLPRIRFHDLRHTYASLLILQGEHPKYIQAQMGHSSIKVTMDIYGHLMEGINIKATHRLDATLFGSYGSKMVAEAKTKKFDIQKMLDFTGGRCWIRTSDFHRVRMAL